MSSGIAMQTDELLVDRIGCVTVLTLNRPRQLNVLSLSMVRKLQEVYARSDADPEIKAIVVRGAGERPCLCAGGDVKRIYEMRTHSKTDSFFADALSFFAAEYVMNSFLGRLTTPHVALMDGIVMGGGCGVSVNGSHRCATERTVLSMPECAIGLVPDVGGTHFLSKVQGELGTMLALTGRRLSGLDANVLGLATHTLASDDVPRVVNELATALADVNKSEAAGVVGNVLSRLETQLEAVPSDVAPRRAAIDGWFAGDSLEDIVAALTDATKGNEGDLAKELLEAIQAGSPTSLKVTLAMLRRASSEPSLVSCLQTELCAVAGCLARADFYEGVRALLVDKGKGPKPAWRVGRLEEVSAEDVEAHLAPETEEVEVIVARFREEANSGDSTARL